MALDNPQKNKMVQTPPAKKGYHFPATFEYLAEFIEATNIDEATEIYHRIKRLINAPVQSTASAVAEEQSEEKEVQ